MGRSSRQKQNKENSSFRRYIRPVWPNWYFQDIPPQKSRFHLFFLFLMCEWNIIWGQITSKATSNLGELQEILIFSSTFSDHNVVRSDINHRKMTTTTRGNTNNLKAKPPKFKFEFNKIQIFLGKKKKKTMPK